MLVYDASCVAYREAPRDNPVSAAAQAPYPPSPTELFIPPLPMPDRIRGIHFTAEFDVDREGRGKLVSMTPLPDARYETRVREVLKTFRFRPATTPDGTSIAGRAVIAYDF